MVCRTCTSQARWLTAWVPLWIFPSKALNKWWWLEGLAPLAIQPPTLSHGPRHGSMGPLVHGFDIDCDCQCDCDCDHRCCCAHDTIPVTVAATITVIVVVIVTLTVTMIVTFSLKKATSYP